jgi:hypothetical protein
MKVLAIDPGPTQSAWVLFDGERVLGHAIEPNDAFLLRLRQSRHLVRGGADRVVIEKVESFGMAVGEEVFETVFWSGRFAEAVARPRALDWRTRGWVGSDVPVHRIGRRAVKVALCGSARAKDANVRQALLDRFGPKGTKKSPGPLYGLTSHAWAALAVAVAYLDEGGCQ